MVSDYVDFFDGGRRAVGDIHLAGVVEVPADGGMRLAVTRDAKAASVL